MRTSNTPAGQAWRLGTGPFVFSGRPPFITGQLEIINTSDERVRVRAIPATSTDAPQGMAELRVLARVPAHGRAQVSGHFVVDRGSTPGRYTAELRCGDQREDIVVHVLDRDAVRTDPGTIRLRGRAGDVLPHTVVASNDGNVAHAVPKVLLVFFEEQDWIGRSVVDALRDTEPDTPYSGYLDRLLREFRSSLLSPARVIVDRDVETLEPGHVAEMTLRLSAPPGLVKGRHYVGSTTFLGRPLQFELECTGAAGSRRKGLK